MTKVCWLKLQGEKKTVEKMDVDFYHCTVLLAFLAAGSSTKVP
jgi:hypothetical protein